jgi:tetratricopeptide (TPR) repeat protein
LTLWALARKHWAAFFGIWFFGLLGPSSSFMPIKDIAEEHRMYLPIAGVIGALVAIGYFVLHDRPKWAGIVVGILALALGIRTSLRNADYATSVDLWRSTVEARPDNTRAWTNYGEALSNIGRMDWAAEAYQKAIALNANVPDAYYNLGNSFRVMKQYDQAEQAYQKAIALDPAYLPAYVMLGNIYQDMGQLQKSEDAFRGAIAHRTRDSDRFTVCKAFYNLGNTLVKMNRFQDAMSEYRHASEIEPKYDKPHYGLGFALVATKNKREALNEYIRAVELNPRSEARQPMLELARELGVQLPPSVSSPAH